MRSKRYLFNLLLFVFALIVTAICAFTLWLCDQQARIFAYPPRHVAGVTPDDFQVEDWRNIQFTTNDGISLEGWFIPPRPGNGTIIFVHGHSSNRAQHLAEAAWLNKEGYGALLFDLRNHGTSGGNTTSMGMLEASDVQAAFDFLSTQPEVQPERVGLYGTSMGGAAAIRAISDISPVRLLIVESTYADLVGVVGEGIHARTNLPGFPFAHIITWMVGNLTGTNLFDLQLIEHVQQIQPIPILILHGTADPLVPLQQAQNLYRVASEPKELLVVDGGIHGGLHTAAPENYERTVLDFITRFL